MSLQSKNSNSAKNVTNSNTSATFIKERGAAGGSPVKIAITNEKGGCAKTTTAVNLSAILAEQGFKTLLIDMDYQSYASHNLSYQLDSIQRLAETASDNLNGSCNTNGSS